MPSITSKLIFLLLSFSASSFTFAGDSQVKIIENIKNDFIQAVSVDIEDYHLCELYSKRENKKEFIEKTIHKDFTKNMKGIHWKEMQIREEAATNHLHLGVVVIQYSSEKDAINVLTTVNSKPANYLANSKILTRYIAIRENDNVAFIYSETFIDDKVKSLFDKLARSH